MKRQHNGVILENGQSFEYVCLTSKLQRSKLSNTPLNICPQLAVVFEDIDLSTFPNLSPNAPPDALANYIIENPHLFKEKELKKKEIKSEDGLEPTIVNLVNVQRVTHENLLSEFMAHFHDFFQSESCADDNLVFEKEIVHQLIQQEFPHCRTLLIEHLMMEFSGRYSAVAAVCLFVESDFARLVQKYFLHVENNVWDAMVSLLPIARKRRRTWIDAPTEGNVFNSLSKYQQFLAESKKKFPELIVDKLISATAEDVQKKEKSFTCVVCFDDYPVQTSIKCSASEIIDLLPKEQSPSTSNDNNANGPHSFCLECVRGQALAATTDMPLAGGGVGLKCMEPNCLNPILFSSCRSLIPYKIRKLLNERILEETLSMANIQNLERCRRCNYAVEFEVPKDTVKVFSCFKCGYEFCRVCERQWDRKHFGKRCEELGKDENIDLEARKIEQKMNETRIHKCHQCNLPYVKLDGCNRVHCRCGAIQCYVCRQPNITYAHFCSHLWQPQQSSCKKCKKKCLLWEDVETRVDIEVEKIRKEAQNIGVVIGKL